MSQPIDTNVSGDTPTIVSGTYATGSVSVTTAVTLIVTVPGGYNGGVVVRNGGTGTVYLGGSAVTSATGLPVASSTSQLVPGGKGIQRALYGIGSASETVTYLLAE